MADTVAVEYVYPPNMLDGAWEEKSGNKRYVVRMTGVSDGTGETDAVKINLSDLKTVSGNVPTRTAVEWIKWNVQGMGVLLEWDRAPNALIRRMNDVGFNNNTIDRDEMNYEQVGGLLDPGGDDGTGDIILTTLYAVSGDNYTIDMCIRVKD